MKIVVEKDKIIKIDDIDINSGSIRYYRVDFEFDETWNDLTKKVVIINRKTTQAKEFAIIDNYVYLDVFESGDYSVGVVGYTLNEENEKEYQISTNLRTICIKKGAGQFRATINEIPSISEWEIYINQIQELCNGVVIKNIEEEVDGLNHNFTINYTDGTSFEFTIKDGENASSEGTSNYNDLINKPQINGVPLQGNKTSEDFGIKQEYTANDITFEDGETFQQKYDNGELKGDKGDKGDTGANGQNGANGQDGFSPTVTTTPISNGTKVSITDKTGTKEFDVMNGEQGAKGEKGEDGTDGKTPVKGVDYFTEDDKQEFVNEVEQALTPQFDNKLDKNQGADGLVVPKDVPSTGGGSSSEWELVADITIEEEVSRIQINENQQGQPFTYNEMYFRFTLITNDTPGQFWVNNSKMMMLPTKNTTNNMYGFLKVYNDSTLISVRGTNLILSTNYGSYIYHSFRNESEITQFLLTNIRAQAGSVLKVYGR